MAMDRGRHTRDKMFILLRASGPDLPRHAGRFDSDGRAFPSMSKKQLAALAPVHHGGTHGFDRACNELEAQVDAKMKEGYTLYGAHNMSTAQADGNTYVYLTQAMIRE